MTLRNEIAEILSRDHSLTRRQRVAIPTAADVILSLVQKHLISDEALDRFAVIAWQSIQMIDPKVNREEMPRALREAIRTALNDTAALGEGE